MVQVIETQNGEYPLVRNINSSLKEVRQKCTQILYSNEYGDVVMDVVEKMYVAFSHKLSPQQIEDAEVKLKVCEFISLPENFQKPFSQVSPLATWEELQNFAQEIIKDATERGCTIMFCTGEPSLMLAINLLAKEVGMTVVQSTTERKTTETIQPDGTSIKTQIFSHVAWREILK